MKRRDANLILIALAAFGGGIIVFVLPLPLLEMIFSASGLSDRFPAFAHPLGTMARSLLIGAGGMTCAVVTALLLPWRPKQDRSQADGEERGMSFIFSRLFSRVRRRKSEARAGLEPPPEVSDFSDVPVLRRSDSHPDAPARPPVSARRDLGEEALPAVDAFIPSGPPPETGNAEEFAAEEPAGEEQKHAVPASDPLPWALIEQQMSRIQSGGRPSAKEGMPSVNALNAAFTPVVEPESAPAGAAAQKEAGSKPDNTSPTTRELVERLERGFERRRIRAQSTPDAESSPE